MAFIRVKKRIKGEKEYYFAYEVENKWYKRAKTTKQKVKKYLGRVFTLNRPIKSIYANFQEYLGVDEDGFIEYLDRVNLEEMILDLVEYTLLTFTFEFGVGREKNKLLLDDYVYDTLKYKLYSASTKKPIVLELNEGYLCDHSIRQLLRFNPNKYDDKRVLGQEFAKLILGAGLFIRPEVFVELFEKLQKEKLVKSDEDS